MKKYINRAYVIIRWRYLWNIQMRYSQLKARQERKLLWRVYASKAVYKVYGAGKGSGWTGRYTWKKRVLCYVDEIGNKWF